MLVSISLLLFWNPLDYQGIWFYLVWDPRFLCREMLYFLHRWKQFLLRGYEKSFFVKALKTLILDPKYFIHYFKVSTLSNFEQLGT